jgi:chromosomal replication initiator protein
MLFMMGLTREELDSMQDVKGMWQSVLGELEVTVTRAHFSTWLKPTYIVSNEDGHVIVGVPNIFNKRWMENKYHSQVMTALSKLDNRIKTIEYKVVGKPGGASHTPEGAASSQARQAKRTEPLAARTEAPARHGEQISMSTAPPAQTNLNPRYTFESFVVGSSNDFAHAACQAVAKSPGTKYNPLFIYGGVGLGKTHLMQAVGNEILRKDNSKRIEYVTIEGFTNEFINSISKKRNESFVEKYRSVDVLIIDDMQFLAGKEKTQDEFFHTFNALHQANKQIIISSDKPPKMLTMLEDRLISRFEMGITVDIQSPDLETRSAIIQSKATSQGIVLPLEVIDFIARHAQSNIRELEGTLTKVLAEAEHRGGEVTLPRIQQLLAADAAARPKLRPLSPKTIIDRVAAYYDLQAADICGAKRDKEIVVPRQVTMYLMREELALSFPKIATAIGGRDHTTAMHSVSKIEKLVEVDENLRGDIAAIRERLGAASV